MHSEAKDKGASLRATEVPKSTPTDKSTTPMMRAGSVKERISKLQAKLTPSKSDQLDSSIPEITPTTSRDSLSTYALSKLILSPSDRTRPAIATRKGVYHIRSVVGQSPRDKDGKGVKASTSDEHEQFVSAAVSVEENHERQDLAKNDSNDASSLKTEVNYEGEDEMSTGESRTRKPSKQDTADVVQSTPIKRGIKPRHAISSSSSARAPQPISSESPRVLGGHSPSGSRIPRRVRDKGKDIEPRLTGVATPAKGKARLIGTSHASAYSKILPYTSDDSAFVPRRTSSNYGGQDVAPTNSEVIDSTILLQNEPSQGPSVTPSPRRRSSRSLRRRTFYNRNEDNPGQETAREVVEEFTQMEKKAVHALEDVFKSPFLASKPDPFGSDAIQSTASQNIRPYHVDSPFVADNKSPASAKSIHDITNPNYKPSVMPRQIESREIARKRHGRVTSSVRSQQASGSYIRPIIEAEPKLGSFIQALHKRTNSSGFGGAEEKSDPGDGTTIVGIDSRIVSADWAPRGGYFTDGQQSSSDEMIRVSNEIERIEQPVPRPRTAAFLSGEADHGTTNQDSTVEHRTISISVLGSPRISRIPQPLSRVRSIAASSPRPSSNASPRVLAPLSIGRVQNHQERGLRVVVTMDQNIHEVIKIEVHPSPSTRLYNSDSDKENRGESETY